MYLQVCYSKIWSMWPDDLGLRTTQDRSGTVKRDTLDWSWLFLIQHQMTIFFVIYRSFGSLTMTLHSTEADPSLFSAMHIYTPASPILGLLISSWQTPKPQLILYFGLSTISTYFGLKIMLIQDQAIRILIPVSVTQNQNYTQ